MLQFNNNHIFTGYLKQFLASFNLPACRIYTAEFEKYFAEHGQEDPRVIESNQPIKINDTKIRPAVGVTYLKNSSPQQYFWDTKNWERIQVDKWPRAKKYWKNNKNIHYNGNKILGLTKTLKNPTTLYNYQTHEYLGDYLRFLRDYENINLMSMYNCFSNRLCSNIKVFLEWKETYTELDENGNDVSRTKTAKTALFNAYDTNYKIYMLPIKLFENYTIAIDCFQGVELFCGFYNEKLDESSKARTLMKQTYCKIPRALFNQPFIYDKLDVKYWNWLDENTGNPGATTVENTEKFLRAEIAARESELKLFIKVPATNTSSIAVLEGNYLNYNDSLFYIANPSESVPRWEYKANSTVANFETTKTERASALPSINSREFKPISKLQLLALNTGISYPFADRLIEYLISNVIVPNDKTPDNIKRLQKVMEDCGYSFQIEGVWEPKMQMILYDYLMNSGKFTPTTKTDQHGKELYTIKNGRVDHPDLAGNLKQRGQKMRSECYDILGYADKDAEKLYASWKVELVERNGKQEPRVIAKNTLENVDIYSNLYNN